MWSSGSTAMAFAPPSTLPEQAVVSLLVDPCWCGLTDDCRMGEGAVRKRNEALETLSQGAETLNGSLRHSTSYRSARFKIKRMTLLWDCGELRNIATRVRKQESTPRQSMILKSC